MGLHVTALAGEQDGIGFRMREGLTAFLQIAERLAPAFQFEAVAGLFQQYAPATRRVQVVQPDAAESGEGLFRQARRLVAGRLGLQGRVRLRRAVRLEDRPFVGECRLQILPLSGKYSEEGYADDRG